MSKKKLDAKAAMRALLSHGSHPAACEHLAKFHPSVNYDKIEDLVSEALMQLVARSPKEIQRSLDMMIAYNSYLDIARRAREANDLRGELAAKTSANDMIQRLH